MDGTRTQSIILLYLKYLQSQKDISHDKVIMGKPPFLYAFDYVSHEAKIQSFFEIQAYYQKKLYFDSKFVLLSIICIIFVALFSEVLEWITT
jgi:hypothetical protein